MRDKAKLKPKDLFITLAVQAAVLIVLFYLATHTYLPIPIIAASCLFILVTFLVLKNYHLLNKAKRVGLIGLSISFGVLSILFALKYYLVEFEISMFHIILIILPPLLLYRYIEKKEGKKDEGAGVSME
jgi:hypothetical protein